MPSFPATYKAAQIQAAGESFKIVDVDWKDPAPGQIVVKVLASGVCHSDSIVVHGLMGVTFPRTPGHEIVGKVVAVGEGEKTWKVGQRVGSGWHGGELLLRTLRISIVAEAELTQSSPQATARTASSAAEGTL